MSDYFKPWQRRIGAVTLVLACAFAMGWLRSFYFRDTVLIPGWIVRDGHSYETILSSEKGIGWIRVQFLDEPIDTTRLSIKWDFIPRTKIKSAPNTDWKRGYSTTREWQLFGILMNEGTSDTQTMCYWNVPYLVPTSLLTLSSAWLLFSQPRTATPQSTAEVS